jgi:HlyD family secretion protein
MTKVRIFTIIGLVLLAGAAIWFFGFRKKEKPLVLETDKPEYGYISKSVTATGTIEPVDTVTVGSQVSGTIKNIYTDFNDRVKKGQLIAELDKTLLQAQVDQFRANLETANSTMAYQKSNFDRQTLLYNTGAISKADFETAQNLSLTARSNVQSVQAQLDAALKNLSYASIYSPVDGVILTRNISIGQTVAASFNTPTLFVIAKDITKMQVQAAVDEADIGDVKQGLRVVFTVDAYPDITFAGTVNQVRLQPVVSSNVVTYTTIITAPNEDLKLKPGMTANIFIYTQEDSNALLISSKALKFKPDASMSKQFSLQSYQHKTASQKSVNPRQNALAPKKAGGGAEKDTSRKASIAYVWVRSGDTLVEKKVHTGLNDDTHVQILDGLTTDDEVVLEVQVAAAASAASGATKSPFMPTRRSGNASGGAKPGAKPGASGGGR